MTTAVFTPKQVARALGVSESSVKRWVDSGRLRAAKTAGGHRKVPLPSVATFVRETGYPIAHPEVLGMVATVERESIESAGDELFDSLTQGRETKCRELVLGYYQRGESITNLGDRLVGPVFRRIGSGWATGDVSVHQERRGCEVMMAVLHELRRWLPPAADDAPVALIATPSHDFAEVPARLVELVLTTNGWRTVMAGSGLPLEEVLKAINAAKPRLVCLSATHLENAKAFVAEFNSLIATSVREMQTPPRLVVGGSALSPETAEQLECDLVARALGDLQDFIEPLSPPRSSDA